MKNSTLAKLGAIYSLGVVAYIFLVALFMNNASKWFGEEDGFFAPVAALTLFVFSALVTGGLVLGKPIMLYLDGQKKDGLKLLLSIGLGLFVYMLLIFVAIIAFK